MAGDGLAVDPLGLFAEPFDEGRAIGDLALGLGQRFAHFGGQDRAQIVLVGHHQVVPFAHDGGAFLAGARGPFLLRDACGCDGARGLGAAQVGDMADHIAPRRIGDGECGLVVGIHPVARDKGLGRQQRGVFQQAGEIGYGIEHGNLR